MKKLLFFLIAFFLVFSALSSEGIKTIPELSPDQAYKLNLLQEIRDFEKKLGFKETKNLQYYSGKTESFDYCYYTPVTELPYSYEDPQLKIAQGKLDGLSLDLQEFDVFCYEIQAVAGAPAITNSLLRASLPRFIFVVFHEDWHEQIDLPAGIEESSANLVGYLAALLFVKEKFGQHSEVFKILERELQNRLKESGTYLNYYQQLQALYQFFNSGEITRGETISRKTDLLQLMAKELEIIWGRKPDQLNNALLAFQMTYIRYFPLMYEVYLLAGCDFQTTTATLITIPGQKQEGPREAEGLGNMEKAIVDFLLEKIEKTEPKEVKTCMANPAL